MPVGEFEFRVVAGRSISKLSFSIAGKGCYISLNNKYLSSLFYTMLYDKPVISKEKCIIQWKLILW